MATAVIVVDITAIHIYVTLAMIAVLLKLGFTSVMPVKPCLFGVRGCRALRSYTAAGLSDCGYSDGVQG